MHCINSLMHTVIIRPNASYNGLRKNKWKKYWLPKNNSRKKKLRINSSLRCKSTCITVWDNSTFVTFLNYTNPSVSCFKSSALINKICLTDIGTHKVCKSHASEFALYFFRKCQLFFTTYIGRTHMTSVIFFKVVHS